MTIVYFEKVSVVMAAQMVKLGRASDDPRQGLWKRGDAPQKLGKGKVRVSGLSKRSTKHSDSRTFQLEPFLERVSRLTRCPICSKDFQYSLIAAHAAICQEPKPTVYVPATQQVHTHACTKARA